MQEKLVSITVCISPMDCHGAVLTSSLGLPSFCHGFQSCNEKLESPGVRLCCLPCLHLVETSDGEIGDSGCLVVAEVKGLQRCREPDSPVLQLLIPVGRGMPVIS